MWTIGDEGGAEVAPARSTECVGCGELDLAGDDFCHGCGHAFAHLAGHASGGDDPEAEERCPLCASGAVTALDHGRRQCDACGYMVRDEG